MGLFSRKKKEKPQKEPERTGPVRWSTTPTKPTEILGGENYGDTIIFNRYWYPDVRIRGTEHYGIDYGKLHKGEVQLVAEPNNEYDPKAIRVEQDGQMLGHLPANRLLEMVHEFPGKRIMNTIRAELVKVDEEEKLLEIEMTFTETYMEFQSDYPSREEYEKSMGPSDDYDYLDL